MKTGQDALLLPIITSFVDRFVSSFTSRLSREHLMKWSLNVPLHVHLKGVHVHLKGEGLHVVVYIAKLPRET